MVPHLFVALRGVETWREDWSWWKGIRWRGGPMHRGCDGNKNVDSEWCVSAKKEHGSIWFLCRWDLIYQLQCSLTKKRTWCAVCTKTSCPNLACFANAQLYHSNNDFHWPMQRWHLKHINYIWVNAPTIMGEVSMLSWRSIWTIQLCISPAILLPPDPLLFKMISWTSTIRVLLSPPLPLTWWAGGDNIVIKLAWMSWSVSESAIESCISIGAPFLGDHC